MKDLSKIILLLVKEYRYLMEKEGLSGEDLENACVSYLDGAQDLAKRISHQLTDKQV